MRDMREDAALPAVVTALEANMATFWMAYGDGPGCERYDAPELAQFITGIPHPFFNAAFGPQPSAAMTDAAIEAAIARATARHVPMFWWIGSSPRPADLGERLAQHGVMHVGRPPGMALDLAGLPTTPAIPPGATISEVRDDEDLQIWMRTLITGYELPMALYDPLIAIESDLLAHHAAPNRRYYLARDGETPVAASVVVTSHGVAGIFAVATLPESRGRGIGGAITAVPLHAARDAGYRVGVLQASERGYPVYRRLGFRDVCTLDLYLLPPGA